MDVNVTMEEMQATRNEASTSIVANLNESEGGRDLEQGEARDDSSFGRTSNGDAPSTSRASRSHLSGSKRPEDNSLPVILHYEEKEGAELSDDDEDSPYCRICFEGPTPDEPLFRPCDCKGSVAYVHHCCLSKWVSDSQRVVCELCEGKFRVPPGIKPFVPTTAILNKACQVAADSMTRSVALYNLLPQGSGSVTSNSAIIYLRGYGHSRGCAELGLCEFSKEYPTILESAVTEEQWQSAVDRLNKVAKKMVNSSWRFVLFIGCLIVNVTLIISLSLVDHAVVIPFMFAVIMIQLLPAILFAWLSSNYNTRIQAELVSLCSQLTDEFASEGITFGFHTITADFRRNRLWNPYSVSTVGNDPRVIKFLTVERGSLTLEVIT